MDTVNTEVTETTQTTPVIKKRKGPGGPMPGSGRKKGSTTKLSAERILNQIENTCGKPFEELLAEGYQLTIIACDMPARQKYEQMILNKVIADKQELDVTTLGQSLNNKFVFPQKELPEFSSLPIDYSIAK
jgi:hypothetical protein